MDKREAPALEKLQADLICLMNHYSAQPSRLTARAIAGVLEGIIEHPLIEVFPEFRDQCVQGLRQWKLRAVISGFSRASAPACTLH